MLLAVQIAANENNIVTTIYYCNKRINIAAYKILWTRTNSNFILIVIKINVFQNSEEVQNTLKILWFYCNVTLK